MGTQALKLDAVPQHIDDDVTAPRTLEVAQVVRATGRNREPGELCKFVAALGCSVSWSTLDDTLYSWCHSQYGEGPQTFESAEDCAADFMRYLTGKLAYEQSLDVVPHGTLSDHLIAVDGYLAVGTKDQRTRMAETCAAVKAVRQ